MNAWVGDSVEPMAELRVEIIEVAERAAEEEVLADVAERPLHFALRFGPIGSTGARLEAVVPGKIEQAAIVNDQAVGILADHRRLHAVVEDFLRRPANRFERRHVTAQDGLQVLVYDEAGPDQPRRQKRIGAPLLGRPRAIGRRLQAACDVSADRLAIHVKLAGDRRNGQSLPMKFQNHHEFPDFDHRAAPSRQGEQHRGDSRRPTSRGMPRGVGRHDETGENSTPINGEDSTPAHNRELNATPDTGSSRK